MNFKKIMSSGVLLSALVPFIASAQTPIENLAERLIFWLNRGIVILITVATLFFIYAVIGYIREKDSAKMKDKKQQMINGIIGLFVIVSVWGIIGLVSQTLGTNRGGTQSVPCPPGTFYDSFTRRCM